VKEIREFLLLMGWWATVAALFVGPVFDLRLGPMHVPRLMQVGLLGRFFLFYIKKNKNLKIYVGFGKFQKYTPIALWGRQGSNVIFFLQI